MKKNIHATILGSAAALLIVGQTFAADVPVVTKAPPAAPPPPIWDVAFGGVIASDYYFRGISQSNRSPSVGAYVESRYNSPYGQWYVGIAGYSINWPLLAANGIDYGFTDPSAEIDFTGGWRHEWGPASVDIGLIYYYYPGEQFNGATRQSDFWEVYWKGGYKVNDKTTVGANIYYSPDVLHYSTTFRNFAGVSTKAQGVYASLIASHAFWSQGDWTASISGELGHWWLKDTGFNAVGVLNGIGPVDPDYTYWNAGIALAYKAVTLDLRYHGTDQSRRDCAAFLLITTANKASNWCKDAFIVSLKFDTTLSALK